MKLTDLEAINAATRHKLETGTAEFPADAYFGFYEVDLFDCPPFLMFTANDSLHIIDLVYNRRFEPASMKLWCRLAVGATGIFDIGANVGIYSLAAASLRPELRIQAFEPNPYAFARLRIHKTVNKFDNLVDNPLGLLDCDGVVVMNWARKKGQPISSGGNFAGYDMNGRESTVAEARQLDSMPAAKTIGPYGLIKIDVEGAEAAVFAGMHGVIAQRPDIIIETFSQTACDAINATVLPLGYRVYRILEDEVNLIGTPRLKPAAVSSGNFNQFLTCRPEADIFAALGRRAWNRPST